MGGGGLRAARALIGQLARDKAEGRLGQNLTGVQRLMFPLSGFGQMPVMKRTLFKNALEEDFQVKMPEMLIHYRSTYAPMHSELRKKSSSSGITATINSAEPSGSFGSTQLKGSLG